MEEITKVPFGTRYFGAMLHARALSPMTGIVCAMLMRSSEQEGMMREAILDCYKRRDFNAYGLPNIQHIAPIAIVAYAHRGMVDGKELSTISRLVFLNAAGEAFAEYDEDNLRDADPQRQADKHAELMRLIDANYPDLDGASAIIDTTVYRALTALAIHVSESDSLDRAGLLDKDIDGNYVLDEDGNVKVSREKLDDRITELEGAHYEAAEIADKSEPDLP